MTESDAELGSTLLVLARNAIAAQLKQATTTTVDHPNLHKTAATFVTLTQNGQLRGCIGTLEAWRPLITDVQENACSAAFRDPRFVPLNIDELERTRVEVSLLSSPKTIHFQSEADAIAQLRPMIDGIIFTAGRHRSTFLPQVWEQLTNPASFLAELKKKAGLPASYWAPNVQLERYTVEKWKEAIS